MVSDVSDDRSPLAPYLFLFAAALLWGASPVIMKLLVEEMPPAAVVALRYIIATLGLVPFAVPAALRWGRRAPAVAWLELLGVGLLGSGIGALLFVWAVKLGSPGVVNALSKAQPIFVVFLAAWFLRERVTTLRIGLIVAMLLACVLIGAGEFSISGVSGKALGLRLLGDLLALLAGLAWAMAVVLGKRSLEAFPPVFVAFSRFAVGAVFNSGVAFAAGASLSLSGLGTREWGLLGGLGLICGSFALVLYYRGLARAEAHVAASLGLIESVFTIILAVGILRDPLNSLHVGGISVLLFGAYLIVSRAAEAPDVVGDEGGQAVVPAAAGDIAPLDLHDLAPLAPAETPEVHFGLRLKVASLAVGLIVATMTVTSSLSVRRTQRLIAQQIDLTLTNMADQIGELAVVPSPPSWRTYRQYLGWLVQRDVQGEGFRIEPVFIAIVDENDQVRAFAMRADHRLVDEQTGQPYAAWNPAVQRSLTKQAEQGQLGQYGIVARRVAYGEPSRRVLVVGFRQEIAYEALHRIATINAAITMALVLVGIVLSIALSGELIRPIERLTKCMQRVGLGDLDQRVDLQTGDELGVMGARFNQMLVGLKERAFLRAALTRYVSVQVAEKMLAEGTWLFEPEKREVTVMFCDIRGFTPLSERLTPGQVFRLLNEYFGIMVDVIFAHGGTLDKFMGDCIMAVWGSPQVTSGHAESAVEASLDMRRALAELNEARRVAGEREIHVGIGLNTGVCYAGSLGATGSAVRRLEYAVIGDDINVAQRIESKTGPMQILISESTYQAVAERVVVERLEPIAAKGKSQPVPVYLLKGFRPQPPRSAPGTTERDASGEDS